MKDKNEKRQDEKKVLPIEQYRSNFAEDSEDVGGKSVHQLLQHMRKMREVVPVNYQLQDDLREKLLKKQAQAQQPDLPFRPRPELSVEKVNANRFVSKQLWLCLSLILLVLFLISNGTRDHSLQPVGTPKEIVRVWNADNNLSFSVLSNEGVLIARHGQLLLSDKSPGQYQVLDVATDWLYHSPAISPNGDKVALVRQRQGAKTQIVTIQMNELKNNVRVIDPNGFTVLNSANNIEQYTDLEWSPDGAKLAYTVINKQNDAEVWINDAEERTFLTKGTNPAWSPDGTQLVVQREVSPNKNMLALIDLQAGTEMLLGEGEQPVWGNNGYLAFVSASQQERVLTFMPDGTPQFTVQQRVGEIRTVFAGENGQKLMQTLDENSNWLALSTLLVSPDKGATNKEMDWLRQMELQGVREPRVLILDEVEKCHNPVFSEDGKILFYTRQDQGATTILQVDVEERPIDRGVK